MNSIPTGQPTLPPARLERMLADLEHQAERINAADAAIQASGAQWLCGNSAANSAFLIVVQAHLEGLVRDVWGPAAEARLIQLLDRRAGVERPDLAALAAQALPATTGPTTCTTTGAAA